MKYVYSAPISVVYVPEAGSAFTETRFVLQRKLTVVNFWQQLAELTDRVAFIWIAKHCALRAE